MPVEQSVKRARQTTPRLRGPHGCGGATAEDAADVQVPRPVPSNKGRAWRTAATWAQATKRLRLSASTPPPSAAKRRTGDAGRVNAATVVPDEELSELLDLHHYGESVHWPSGWSAVKAAAHLAIARRLG